MKNNHKLAIIIPSYNEIENLENTSGIVSAYLQELVSRKLVHPSSFIMFVDDGSVDGSEKKLSDLQENTPNIFYKSLNHNYGHQIALIAGMDASVEQADVMITMDCDLQQELFAIERFLESYEKGNKIVLGVREDRSEDSLFKSLSARLYHFCITSLGIKYVKGHADYRLVESKVYKELQNLIWANQFLRSVFSNTNYQTDIQLHKVSKREIGSSKYSLKKMVGLALEGIFTNSLLTLKTLGYLGLFTSLFSVLLIIYGLYVKAFFDPVDGFTTLLIAISFFGGSIVFGISLLSECILRLLKQFLGDRPYKLK